MQVRPKPFNSSRDNDAHHEEVINLVWFNTKAIRLLVRFVGRGFQFIVGFIHFGFEFGDKEYVRVFLEKSDRLLGIPNNIIKV